MAAKSKDIAAYPTRMRDKVAIVGFADGHRHMAPFDDPDFEFWGLNRLWSVLPGKPWTRWFEIHDLGMYEDDPAHQTFLKGFGGPVYLRPQDVGRLDIPNGVALPVARLCDDFVPYYTNSVSWMLALAIAMEFQTVHLFGVDMAQDHVLQNEYGDQRPSCEYFLGVAAGRGIEILLPEGSDLLLASHLYGVEEAGPIRSKLEARFQELGNRKNAIKQQVAAAQASASDGVGHVNQLDGAMQEIQYQLRNLSPSKESR